MTGREDRIVIALRSGSPNPSGHLELAGGTERPFTGWLGLLSALGSAFEQTRSGEMPGQEDGIGPNQPESSPT